MAFSFTSFAQIKASGSSSVAATIVTPVAISNTGQMNFGNITADVSSGAVVIDPAGSGVNTIGVKLSDANSDTASAAVFIISGDINYVYTITLPSSDYTLYKTPGESVIINAFSSNSPVTGLLTGGSRTISVGATLNIGAYQTAGIYTNSTGFDVTVNYN